MEVYKIGYELSVNDPKWGVVKGVVDSVSHEGRGKYTYGLKLVNGHHTLCTYDNVVFCHTQITPKGLKKEVFTDPSWVIGICRSIGNGKYHINAHNTDTHEVVWFDVTKSYLKKYKQV